MSRVYWHMGQALLPEHFYAQEQGLREELSTHFAVRAAPAWGVVRLVWDEFRLSKGTIALEQMTVLLRSGILVDVPGNAAPAQLDLSAAGVTRAQVYLHLQSDHETVVEHADASVGGGGIERIVQKIELSTRAYSDTSAEVFALAELACGADGTWALVPQFCPPLAQIGAEPFFRTVRARMDAVCRALRELLKKELSDNYLAAEGQSSAKQCLRGLYRFEVFVLDMQSGIRPHPYTVFCALRELYTDVCMFREVHPDKLSHAYEHERIAESVGLLLEELERQVLIVRAELPYLEFSARPGRHECSFDGRLKRAKDVYLLVQKPSVSTQVDLRRVKLASESRIQAVHQRALRGIPFERLDSPPFVHGLASTVDFYALRPGEEWDYAVSEGNLVLFDAPQLTGSRLYLYWREG